jgi:hypothetical protein
MPDAMLKYSYMPRLAVSLSLEEAQALLELVDNQLFRIKFIDSKIPGYKANPEKLRVSTSAVDAVRAVVNKAKGIKTKSIA